MPPNRQARIDELREKRDIRPRKASARLEPTAQSIVYEWMNQQVHMSQAAEDVTLFGR